MTDANRVVLDRTEWEPYGAAVSKPAYDGVGHTGHVMDGATGMTYMQQRYYDPSIGRFLSVDPVAANANTGASFNRYWYANNNPYKFTDPDGRQAFGSNDPAKDFQRYGDGGAGAMLLCACDPYYVAPSGSGELQPTSYPGEIFIPARGVGVATERAVASTFRIVEREGNVLIGAFKGAAGEGRVITEAVKESDTLILRGLHIEGKATLKEALQVAREFGKSQGVKRVVIEPGKRTTGANPGHTPRRIVVEVEKKKK